MAAHKTGSSDEERLEHLSKSIPAPQQFGRSCRKLAKRKHNLLLNPTETRDAIQTVRNVTGSAVIVVQPWQRTGQQPQEREQFKQAYKVLMLVPSKQCLSSTDTQYDIHRVQAQPDEHQVDQLEVHGQPHLDKFNPHAWAQTRWHMHYSCRQYESTGPSCLDLQSQKPRGLQVQPTS